MDQAHTSKPYRIGVIAIILDRDNNFLLIQKNSYKENEWNFLGGGREDGETLEQNLFREIKEEIGLNELDIEVVGISNHKIEYDYPPELAIKINGNKYRGQSYDQAILRFTGNKEDLNFTPEEFSEHIWVSARELSTHLVFPNQYQNHKVAIDEILPGLL